MSLSSSSGSDRDEEDREILNKILAKSGKSPIEIPNDVDSDSDSSSGSDVHDWFRQLQDKFALTSADANLMPRPLNVRAPESDSDDDNEDVAEMMATIYRRFDQYQNDALKEQSRLQEAGMAVTDIASGSERTDASSKNTNILDQLPDPGFSDSHQYVDESCNLSVKALTYSQFPKSAQNFVDALKKNRSCQRFIRTKLMEIEAKAEENKKLKERIKCLVDFQLACKRKVGRNLCLKKDPRIRLISMQKPRKSKAMKHYTKFPALYFGPAENSHVSKYKMVMRRFPISFKKQPWSNIEKENLAKGLTQQYQEMSLLNAMNLESDSEGSMNPDLLSAMLNNDLEVTPERIRSFLPMVNWDRLASMYLSGRSGAECESRWLNCDDPLINHGPWTILEDKKLLFIVQERGIYNWIDIALMIGTQRTPFQCLARYQRSLNPHILNKEWSQDEDARLREAIEIFGESNWQLVASYVEGRAGTQCSNRWLKTLNPERRKVGRWSVDEDKHLKVAVMLFGAKNWNKIAQFAPGRTQVQCRERWLNCLDPSLKLEPWTEEEDDNLLAAIDEHGYCWSKVATCVPPRTDNQCMRRWKFLLPHEVPLLRAARRMKRTVLISNFVDRESERPAIGPSDFSSLENHHASECGNGRQTRKRREGARKENQGEASCDKKIKKSKSKSRMSQENATETSDLSLVPAGTSASTNTDEIRSTKGGPSVQKTKKSKAKSRMYCEENVTENGDLSLVPVGTGASTDTGEIDSTKKRKRGSSGQKINKSKAKSKVSSEENVTETGNPSLVPAGTETSDLSLVPAEAGACTDPGERNIKRRKRGPSDNDAQFRRSSMFMEDRVLVNGFSGADYRVDICADEDVPLKSWLQSLALEARKKRPVNKSRSLAATNQKNTYCDVAEAIPSLDPGAKRKRSSREPTKKVASRYQNNSLSNDKNDRSCNLIV